jgi:succinate dehydrogenase/fumarate reductase cytochrome b subunit
MIFLPAAALTLGIFLLLFLFLGLFMVTFIVYLSKSKNRNYENYNPRDKIIYNIGAILFAILLVYGSLFALLVNMFKDTM